MSAVRPRDPDAGAAGLPRPQETREHGQAAQPFEPLRSAAPEGGARSAPDTRKRRSDVALLALIFALALALRLVAAFQYEAHHPNAQHPAIDEAAYDRWARTIANGDWMGHEVFFQEPLYPYALGALYALFGDGPMVVRAVQCGLGALAVLLCAALAGRVFGRRAGFVAAISMALYWPGLLFPCLLLKENLFVPLVLLLALLLVRARDSKRSSWLWLAVGITAGLGALLRGNLFVLLPVIVLWPVARALFEHEGLRRSSRSALLVLIGIAGVLSPVALRNWKIGGVFVLTTSGAGTNLYGGNNAENPYGRASEFSFIRGIPEHEAGDWRREAERRTGRRLDPAEVSDFWKSEVWRSVREHPAMHLAILWNKLRLTLGRYEVPDNHMLLWDARYVPIAQLPFPGFGWIGALGLAGLVLFAHRWRASASCSGATDANAAALPSIDIDRRAGLEIALFFLLYLATIVLTVTSDRARLPLAPLLAVFGGFLVAFAADAARAGNRRGALHAIVATFLALIVVHVPILEESEIADDYDERDFNLAVQWLKDESHADEARAIAVRLAQSHPQSSRVLLLETEIDFRRALDLLRRPTADARRTGLKEVDAAAARVERILDQMLDTHNPTLDTTSGPSSGPASGPASRERFRAQSLLGWIQTERGAWPEAEQRCREALAFDPDSRDLRRALSRALIGAAQAIEARDASKRVDEALALLRELRSSAGSASESDDLEVLLAQAEFAQGRVVLAGRPRDEATKVDAHAAIQRALDRLQPLVDASATDRTDKQRARITAGWIQTYLGNTRSAENHFRAALAIGWDANAELGLVQSLVARAESGATGEARTHAIEEARSRLQNISDLDPSAPALFDLRGRLDALR